MSRDFYWSRQYLFVRKYVRACELCQRVKFSPLGSNKLLPSYYSKFIGLFRVLRRVGNEFTIELPRKMRTHPPLYVGRLIPYYQYGASSG